MVRRSKKVSPRRYRKAKTRRSRIRRDRRRLSRSKKPKRAKTRRRSRRLLRGGMQPLGENTALLGLKSAARKAKQNRDAMKPETQQEVVNSMSEWMRTYKAAHPKFTYHSYHGLFDTWAAQSK